MDSVSSYRWSPDRVLSLREQRIYWENEIVRLTQDLGEAVKRNDLVDMTRYDKLLQGAVANAQRYRQIEWGALDARQRRLK